MDNNTPQDNTPQIYASLKPKFGIHSPVILSVAVLVIVALAACAAFFFSPSFRHLVQIEMNALSLPKELHGSLFLVQPSVGGTAFHLKWFTYQREKGTGNTTYPVFAVSRSGQHLASIHTLPNGFFALRFDGKPIMSSILPKISIALSPDTSKVAFTEFNIEAQPLEGRQEGTENWNAVVYESLTGIRTMLGQGFSPFFIDDTHVIRFSSKGIVRTNLADKTEAIIHTAPFVTFVGVSQSPDRSRIAWIDAKTGAVTVARIAGDSIETVMTIPSVKSPVISLSDSALYSLAVKTSGVEVWKYTFGSTEPVLIHTFPPKVLITSLIL